MSAVRLRPAGEHALVVELEPGPEVHALAAAVRERWGLAVEEVVPGERSLLVSWRAGSRPLDEMIDGLAALVKSVAQAERLVQAPL